MEAAERIVFLDTETTGLDARFGHRIIEVAAVEVIRRQITGRNIHFYVDPEREVDPGATAVHGLTWDDLRDKPKFSAVIEPVLQFLVGARVVIHNAAFDVSFLDAELARLRLPPMAERGLEVEDSLALARKIYPGKRNSLDALCDRLGVDNSQRNLHGALLDARLLADVYLAMTRGQGSLDMLAAAPPAVESNGATDSSPGSANAALNLIAIDVPQEAIEAHQLIVRSLGKSSGQIRTW
jgi:DNA polymerase III subunit epsilon